jgi:hypothetical protein
MVNTIVSMELVSMVAEAFDSEVDIPKTLDIETYGVKSIGPGWIGELSQSEKTSEFEGLVR